MKFNKFAILGERGSGINFVKYSLMSCFKEGENSKFNISNLFGYNKEYTKFLYKENKTTFFIFLVRNPYDWYLSLKGSLLSPNNYFYDNDNLKDFILDKNMRKFNDILMSEQKYIWNNGYDNKSVDLSEFNSNNGKKFKNIFEMRNFKNNYILNIVPKFLKNYSIIRYENFVLHEHIILKKLEEKGFEKRNDFYTTTKFSRLNFLHFNARPNNIEIKKNKHNLLIQKRLKHDETFDFNRLIDKIEKERKFNFSFKQLKNISTANLINKHVNWELEKRLGYEKLY